MQIDGSTRVNNINIPVFKGENKEAAVQEQKQPDVSSSEVLNAYGQAMVNLSKKSEEDICLELIDEAIKNYNDKLKCEDN